MSTMCAPKPYHGMHESVSKPYWFVWYNLCYVTCSTEVYSDAGLHLSLHCTCARLPTHAHSMHMDSHLKHLGGQVGRLKQPPRSSRHSVFTAVLSWSQARTCVSVSHTATLAAHLHPASLDPKTLLWTTCTPHVP
jgi:hypothetical protein